MLQPQGRRCGGGATGRDTLSCRSRLAEMGVLHKDRDTEHIHKYDNPPIPVNEGVRGSLSHYCFKGLCVPGQ